MPLLLVLLDGMENSDYAVWDFFSRRAPDGVRNNTPQGMEPDSLNCILNLLGVPSECIPAGRAYLEALALGMRLQADDLVFRCNQIRVDANGVLVSCCEKPRTDSFETDRVQLRHIVQHKYLLVLKGARHCEDSVVTLPPHQHLGRKLEDLLPEGPPPLRSVLRRLIYENNLYPWGQSAFQALPPFFGLHGRTGAVVAKTEIVAGIGKAMGMYVPPLKGATADIDTDLAEKTGMALELAGRYDFVLLHINGLDEAAHRRDQGQKRGFLNTIHDAVLRPLIEGAQEGPDVMLIADHETSTRTGRHVNSDVPYYILKGKEAWCRWLDRS